jgi:hypothetical protein
MAHATDPDSTLVPTAVAALQRAMVDRDGAASAPHLAPDVRVVSPLTDRFAFVGRDAVAALLADASTTFEGLHYTEAFAGPDGRIVLRAEAIVRGATLEELVLVHVDDHGLIDEMTVFLRPFTAAAAFARALTPGVARREAGRGAGFGAARLTGAIATGAKLADGAGARAMRRAPGVETR